jgi:CheY-like chemotaxis protein
MAAPVSLGNDAPANQGWLTPENPDTLAGSTILLVEDDDDIRELMETLLEAAGFVPTACSTAEQAIEELRDQPFDLILTDYMLPNRSGGWLLEQAAAEGLVDDVPVLVVTAHPRPTEVVGCEVMSKPVDLDDLVGRIRHRLGNRREKVTRRRPAQETPDRPDHHDHHECPEPIELILYVSTPSVPPAAAIAAIRDQIARFSPARVRVTLCEIPKRQRNVKRTPAMSRRTDRAPGPRTLILAHITNPQVVMELLASCEGGAS